MFKRMLRAVLVTALSAGIGLGAVSAMDLAWSHPAKSTAAPDDLAWITPAGDKA